MSKRAVILAGGKGARLLPYTTVLPKPLMPIGGFTILEIVVKQLSANNFTDITIAVNHQAALIQSFFGDGKKWGVNIDYSLENEPLSTMAPLKLIKDLPEKFLVMNGDILTDLNFGEFYEEHTEERLFTISAFQRDVSSDFGILDTRNENELIGFREKPVFTFDVSMGIYMLSREVLDYIPEGTKFGFDDLMHKLIGACKFPKVIRHKGYWLDIGRPEDFAKASEEFESNISQFLPTGNY